MSRLLFLMAIIGCVLVVAVDGSVMCTTQGNSGKNKAKIGHIEIAFSQPYIQGTYSLYEALASFSVIHNGTYNRPFPVIDIEYHNVTTIRLFLLETSDAEGTTGYNFHVHYTPLANRSGHLASVAGVSLAAFSCLTVDRSPPSVILQGITYETLDHMFFLFSEPVTREFDQTHMCHGNGDPIDPPVEPGDLVIASPYTPFPDGYSSVYKTNRFDSLLGQLCICADDVVTDKAGNPSIESECFPLSQLYGHTQLEGNRINRARTHDSSKSMSGSTAQYDLNDDGLIDTVYIHSFFFWDQTVLQSDLSGIYVDPSNQLPTREDYEEIDETTTLPISFLPNDYSIDNSFILRVTTPPDFYETHESLRVYYNNINKNTYAPFNYIPVYYGLAVTLPSFPSDIEPHEPRNAFVVSPKITEFVAYNRSYICARVSRQHYTFLDVTFFYYASTSASGNRLYSTFSNTNNKRSACFVLKAPMQSSSVHTRSAHPDLLYLEPRPYGNFGPSAPDQYVGFTENSRIPKWQGKSATLADYQPPTLTYAQLESKDNQSTWQTLRLVFNEPVYVDSGSFAINLVSPSLPINSILVPLSSLSVSRLPHEIELTITATCPPSTPIVNTETTRTIELTTCYGTGAIEVTRVQGIEDELFNLISPIVSGLTLNDRVRPHLVTVTVVRDWTVIFTFSEPVRNTQVQFFSSFPDYILLSTTPSGDHVTLSFAPFNLRYALTVAPCGIFSEDLSGNRLACTDLPVVIELGNIPIDSSSSSSSLSTGAIAGIVVGSVAAVSSIIAFAVYATKTKLLSTTKTGRVHKRRKTNKSASEEHRVLVYDEINCSE